ncbi:PREDICTED: uncharacterized protein LOC104705750 [Camelina sativa]|uniref:Uncharacterized protein LOC104705750 n=1 Tax=Camelina sativa TaxID=90675 RepID=A0ABM0T2Y6_CAMSA|nr:PREDICTED: uncharacterized protein LOC104705750 [Camelina sativa]
MTMQDLSSTVSFSPSFSFYASGDLVEAAVRVVRESESYNYSVNLEGENDKEFQFETLPLGDESFFHFPTTTLKRLSDDDDVAAGRVTSKNLFYGGWSVDPPVSSPSQSHSSSDFDDFSENLSPRRCFWSPIRSPARGDGLKTKSKSSSEPRRCRFKELLRRSHSDGAVSTSSASKRCSFKDLLRRSHSDGGGGQGSSSSTSGNGSPVVKGKNKTVSYKPEVVQRRKSYLPYRQDLIGVFAGMSRFRH